MNSEPAMHVVWINSAAQVAGPAEERLLAWVAELKNQGGLSSLLYGVPGWTEPKFTGRFERAFPLVDLALQLRELGPDAVWVNSAAGLPWPEAALETGPPLVWGVDEAQAPPGGLRPAAWAVFSEKAAAEPARQGLEQSKIHLLDPDRADRVLDLIRALT